MAPSPLHAPRPAAPAAPRALAGIMVGWSLMAGAGMFLMPVAAQAQAPSPPGAVPLTQPLPHPDIAPPVFPVVTPVSWWVIAVGVLLGLGLLALLIWLGVRPRRPRPVPPHFPLQAALQSLEQLRAQVPTTPPSEVARQVSFILRQYLQQCYSVPAPFRTTEEIYSSAAMASRAPLRQRFEPVARLHDRLEFAPHPRTSADCEQLVDAAIAALHEEQRLLAQPGLLNALPPPLPAAHRPSAASPSRLAEPATISLKKEQNLPSS